MIRKPFNSAILLATRSIANNGIYVFNIIYTPADLANDRADEAYVSITLSDGQVYNVIVRATSVAPKLYVTPLTTYGNVETGWHKQDSILIENASTVPQNITSVTVPYGYKLLNTSPPLPTVLAPRDSLWLQVEFDPMGDSDYNANFTVQVDWQRPRFAIHIEPYGDANRPWASSEASAIAHDAHRPRCAGALYELRPRPAMRLHLSRSAASKR